MRDYAFYTIFVFSLAEFPVGPPESYPLTKIAFTPSNSLLPPVEHTFDVPHTMPSAELNGSGASADVPEFEAMQAAFRAVTGANWSVLNSYYRTENSFVIVVETGSTGLLTVTPTGGNPVSATGVGQMIGYELPVPPEVPAQEAQSDNSLIGALVGAAAGYFVAKRQLTSS